MGAIFVGALMLGGALGWRADILATQDYSGGVFVFVYLLGGLGFALLIAGTIDAIAERIAGRTLPSMFRPQRPPQA